MISQSFAIGRENAAQRPPTSPSETPGKNTLSTVLELLSAVDPCRPKKHPMMWSAASHASECTGITLAEMPIESLRQIEPEFLVWLKERRYSPKSISTYNYQLRRLLEEADKLGCTGTGLACRAAWQPIVEALSKVKRAPKTIPAFAISRGTSPAAFFEADLAAWSDWMRRRGRKHRTIQISKGTFKQVVRSANLQHLLPALKCDRTVTPYGIPTCAMPEPLQSQVIRY
jgi:hypothetical protein